MQQFASISFTASLNILILQIKCKEWHLCCACARGGLQCVKYGCGCQEQEEEEIAFVRMGWIDIIPPATAVYVMMA